MSGRTKCYTSKETREIAKAEIIDDIRQEIELIEKELKIMEINYYKKIIRADILKEDFNKEEMQNEIYKKQENLGKLKILYNEPGKLENLISNY